MKNIPQAHRDAIIAKMDGSESMTIAELAEQENISITTLYDWREEAKSKGQIRASLESQTIKNIELIFKFTPVESSELLIVYFGSAAAKYLEGSYMLQGLGCNLLQIRDPGKTWYNGRIPDLCNNCEELKLEIKKVTDKFASANITFAGSSMGGYGALLYGLLLKVGKIVAISPQVILTHDIPHAPDKSIPIEYPDLSRIVQYSGNTKIDYWSGTSEFLDIYNILNFSGLSNVRYRLIPDSLHNLQSHLKRRDLLGELYNSLIDENSINKIDTTDCIPPLSRDLFNKAIKIFYIDKDYDAAKEILLLMLKDNDYAALYHFAGLCCYHLNEFSESIPFFERCIELSPFHYESMYYGALSNIKIGAYNTAEKLLKKAVTLYPSPNSQYYAQLGSSIRLQGRTEEAILQLTKAIEVSSNNIVAHYQIGLAFNDTCEFQKAIDHFRLVLDRKPDWSAARKHLQTSILGKYQHLFVNSQFTLEELIMLEGIVSGKK